MPMVLRANFYNVLSSGKVVYIQLKDFPLPRYAISILLFEAENASFPFYSEKTFKFTGTYSAFCFRSSCSWNKCESFESLVLLPTLLLGEFLTTDTVSKQITEVGRGELTYGHPNHPDACAAA